MTPTRFPELGLETFGRQHWQFVDITDERHSQVGPIYKTKGEALADLDRYHRDSWAGPADRTIPTTCIETIGGDPDTALRLSFQIKVF